ncbi:MAG: ribose-5-phosphate isomerase RpiA [Bacilli bacterium]|nr:ribose-5-phosphate isomerase RpiA [Bacilli bacterium]
MNKKANAAYKAAEYIKDNMTLGLGTGSTAFYLIQKVGELVSKGFNLKCVATSENTKKVALDLKIPLLELDEVDEIDLAIDGVDEIDPDFNAIKGGGGALLREKVVACLSKKVIWIMDDSKTVSRLGNFPLPVEVIRYGYQHLLKKLEILGFNPVLRLKEGNPYLTDNGNYIVDLHLGESFEIAQTKAVLDSLVGVVETGLFLNLCDLIVVGSDEETKVIINKNK